MRLWSLHPKHLDAKGLVALWREGLLARAVLSGATRGYRRHPQLERFRDSRDPVAAIDRYLAVVVAEAKARGYDFDETKIVRRRRARPIAAVSTGQLALERAHLLAKLRRRDPVRFRAQRRAGVDVHPCFVVVEGPPADWERARPAGKRDAGVDGGPKAR